jgi:crotonobetainyl-CoA:carnitine CoA-transferase CaiB-like acyl-CoA transferase
VHHVQGHLKAIGLGHLLQDDRFKNVPSVSAENRELLRREILKVQLTKTADEWMDIYIKDGNIAAEPYRTSVEGMDHPAIVSNTPAAEVQDPRVGPMRQLGLLVDLKDTPGEVGGAAPDVGQHTAEVLARLGQTATAQNAQPSAGAPTPAHPLEGVIILDVASMQAGPVGTTFLADFGPRVIKVDATDERVDEGQRSTSRQVAEPRTYTGKECIAVDLQTPEGKKIMHQLIAKADVLLHNYRLGVPERLGVDWKTCREINPRLVHVWMATYGEKGEYAQRPGAHPIPGAAMG